MHSISPMSDAEHPRVGMFKITDHIEFDTKNRAECPSCQLVKGADYHSKNLALIPGTDGAYKCHRGCKPEEIRAALGEEKHTDRIIPSALAKPPAKPKYHPPKQIKANNELLLNESLLAKEWLFNRGISEEAIEIHKLGIAKRRIGDKVLPCITIPYECAPGQYLQKYRVAPWLDDEHDKWKQDQGLKSRVWFTHKPDNATETWLCEGEWDAITLAQIMRSQIVGNIAIATTTTGAGNVPDREQLEQLVGKVTIWYDLDQPGHDGAHKMAQALGDRALIATVPAPAEHKPGYDVSDAIVHGYTFEDFLNASQQAIPAFQAQVPKHNSLQSRIKSATEIMDTAPDYVEYLCHELITANELQIIASPPRAGKSLLMLSLARCVATGQDFMGRPTEQGKVLYIIVEDDDTKLKQRMIAQEWERDLAIDFLGEFDLSETEQLAHLIEQERYRLVVIDTLTSVRSDDTEESSSNMRKVIKPLKVMAKQLNCAIILVHHTKKILDASSIDDLDIFDTMRGSTVLRSECRGVMVLAPIRKDGHNDWRLVVENGSFAKTDIQTRLDANTLTWKILSGWTPNINKSHEERVLEYLGKTGSASVQQVADECGIPTKSCYTVLTRLVQSQMLTKQGTQRSAVYIRPVQQVQHVELMLNCQNQELESTRGRSSTKGKNIFSDNEDARRDIRNIIENDASFSDAEKTYNTLFVELEAQTQTQKAIQQFNISSTSSTRCKLGGLAETPTEYCQSMIEPIVEASDDGTCNSTSSTASSTSNSTKFKLGDMVKIRTGRYQSMIAPIVGVNDDGTYEVRHKRWQIDRTYRSDDLDVVDPE
jgi:predicted transcriptional regulator